MSREYQILAALRDYLPEYMDAAPQTNLVAAQVVVDYPDLDKMRYPVMLYIVPEGGSWDVLTTETVNETMTITVYVLLKNSETHREMSDMVQAVFDYFAAFTNAINTDPTLGGVLDDSKINSFDFHPAITGMTQAVGLEINMAVQFERASLVLPGGDVYPGEDVHPVGG